MVEGRMEDCVVICREVHGLVGRFIEAGRLLLRVARLPIEDAN